jgi:hypothetical protein
MLGSKLLLAASTLTSVFAQNAHVATTPKAPGLTYLYSSNVTLGTTIDYGTGPKGSRVAIPITGGTFSGPKLKGASKLTSHFSSLLIRPVLPFFRPHTSTRISNAKACEDPCLYAVVQAR